MFGILDTLIVRPIVNILFIIYSLVGDFGLAIIIFTIIVKFAMWPLMKRQLHQTRVMREIQPELAEIKKNCNGNRQMESLQMMDLYKRKNVKPFRSMLSVFIQLPIFIGLFTAINVAVRPRVDVQNPSNDYTVQHSAYSFVEPMNHINTLIAQQNTYLEAVKTDKNAVYDFKPQLFGTLDLSATAGFSSPSAIIILIFALASAVTQYIMARQQDPTRNKKGKRTLTMKNLFKEASDGKEASQEDINAVAQSQMTVMMPFMMLMIMINLPGAIVFYYLLNNIITVFQQKKILSADYTEMEASADKKVLKELREAQEAEVVEKKQDDDKNVRSGHYRSSNQNKKENVHITRISASNKKKRR